jgi:cyclophilin family peptidyl-prolyl cis-trans isomerase
VLALFQAFDVMVVASVAEYLGEHSNAAAERSLLAALRDAKPTDLDLLVSGLKALVPLYDGARPLVHKPSGEAASLVYELQSHPEPLVAEQAARVAHLLGIKPAPFQHRVAAVDLEAVGHIRTARLLTTRGEIILSLDPDNAPITVMNWAGLAERGWFNGLTFHRVVPDFVVQDGDPRGDGMGGPGYAIPDEIAPGHYDEGTIGMALSGPDTGGSQWFVTLSPQPHLDGGYTIFGHVTQGMQVAHALLPGDRILRVTIEHD